MTSLDISILPGAGKPAHVRAARVYPPWYPDNAFEVFGIESIADIAVKNYEAKLWRRPQDRDGL
jgi:hypothetical protein